MLLQDLLSLASHMPPPGTCPTLSLSPTRCRHTEIPILEPIHALSTDYSDYKFAENIHCKKKSVNMFRLFNQTLNYHNQTFPGSFYKLKISNPYIFATWWSKPLIFKTIWSLIHSLKYQSSTTSGYKKYKDLKTRVCGARTVP